MPSFRNELSINDQEIAAALVGEERRQQDGVRTRFRPRITRIE